MDFASDKQDGAADRIQWTKLLLEFVRKFDRFGSRDKYSPLFNSSLFLFIGCDPLSHPGVQVVETACRPEPRCSCDNILAGTDHTKQEIARDLDHIRIDPEDRVFIPQGAVKEKVAQSCNQSSPVSLHVVPFTVPSTDTGILFTENDMCPREEVRGWQLLNILCDGVKLLFVAGEDADSNIRHRVIEPLDQSQKIMKASAAAPRFTIPDESEDEDRLFIGIRRGRGTGEVVIDAIRLGGEVEVANVDAGNNEESRDCKD